MRRSRVVLASVADVKLSGGETSPTGTGRQQSEIARGSAANALNLLLLSAAWADMAGLAAARPGRECRVGPGNFTLSLSQIRT